MGLKIYPNFEECPVGGWFERGHGNLSFRLMADYDPLTAESSDNVRSLLSLAQDGEKWREPGLELDRLKGCDRELEKIETILNEHAKGKGIGIPHLYLRSIIMKNEMLEEDAVNEKRCSSSVHPLDATIREVGAGIVEAIGVAALISISTNRVPASEVERAEKAFGGMATKIREIADRVRGGKG